ncbi:hypothetical protein RBB68_16140 [Leptospira interrogans]|uniref:Uncharacterized protein n=12 Tax=Leptospira interrogans TaxID=173 RepID=Q8EZ35_LEPIN|nr:MULTISPECIES: hypothetical protein [Leptospira]EMG12566.1 hypothetical protein LEP1GSC151_3910 [Leptospira interrogans serovar Grippotyphosa str. LT2186]EMN71875.1 hypothetical protein LEP1GSC100_3034 [Leptospira interrogans serovar Bataviae str. UI 08561]KAA1268918.1 hypothetical protein C5473_13745 [Leptospira interrogans serovar Weerasinghe]AAN51224.1 hypothetical protein LA_4026 [Leptospira interrogans serovar Lai str. 56601]AAS71758.1 conserved hypothetical protein [Leptospira interrog
MILQTKKFQRIMTRYCRFNGFFEEELRSSHIAPEKLDLKNRSLETLFFLFQSICNPSTIQFLHELPDPSWIRFWEDRGIQFCNFQLLKRNSKKIFQSSSTIDPIRTWEEWGSVSDLNDSGEILFSLEKASFSKRLNSKILLTRWKSEQGFQDIPSKILEKPYDLSDLIFEWSELQTDKIVLKPEFSFSGRHKILKFISIASEQWENSNLQKESSWFPCVAQPWVQRIYDFSCLYDFAIGVPTFLGSTIQICDEKGSYNGAYITSTKESEFFFFLLEPIVKKLSESFSPEYQGPVSIDGFEFNSQNIKKIQRISETNYRWSMGRILFELSKSVFFQQKRNTFGDNLSILTLPLKQTIPNYSEWIYDWGQSQEIEIFPLTPDRFASGKSYGTSWVLLRFLKNSEEKIQYRIQKFYSKWRKRILY